MQQPMACNAASLQPSSLRGASHVGRAAPVCRGAFFGGCQRLRAARPQQRRQTALSAQAFQAEWPDPDFIKETKEAFPEKGVATVEEARVRCSGVTCSRLLIAHGRTHNAALFAESSDCLCLLRAAINFPSPVCLLLLRETIQPGIL